MSALRTAIVTIAVLVLVPAWVARSTYVYLCGSAVVAEAHATPCCPVAKKKSKAPPAEPLAKPACCAADEVDLATRAPTATHDELALAAPVLVAIAEVSPLVETARPRVAAVPPRATGPPTYLRTLHVLL